MSELSPTPQKQDVDGKKPQTASLGELLRVDVDKSPTMLNSRRDERESESASVKPEAAQPAAAATETGEAKDPSAAIVATPEAGTEVEATARAPRSAATTPPAAATSAPRSVRAPQVAAVSPLARWGWQVFGLSLASAGVMIIAAKHFSPDIAEQIARFGDPRMLAAALVVGGVVIAGAGMLRRMLRDIRASLDAMRRETARLETIAEDSRSVLDTLKTIRTDNASLTENVSKLQSRLQRLTDLVSSPDYTVSIFRLAASVDQLGKHVAAYMKEQFGIVQQQLSAGAEHAHQADRKLTSALGEIQTLAKDHHRSHALGMRTAFDELRESSEQSFTRIDQNLQAAARIEAKIQAHEQVMKQGFTTVSERSDLSAHRIATGIDDLRSGLDRNQADQAASLRAGFEQLDQRIENAESAHACEIKLQGESFKIQLSSHVADLQESLNAIAELTNRGSEDVAREFDALRQGLEQRAKQQHSSLEQVGEETTQTARAVKLELQAKLEQLQAQIAQQAREHVEQSRDRQSSLAKLLESSSEAARAAKLEISAHLAQLESCLAEQSQASLEKLREQENTLAELRDHSSVTAQAVKHEIHAKLEQIRSWLEQQSQATLEQSREQQTSLHELRDQSCETTLAAKQEISAKLEQLRTWLEQQSRTSLEQSHDQQTTLADLRDQSSEATRAAKAELCSKLEQLHAVLGQHSREHLAALQKNAQDSQQHGDVARRELAASLAQLHTHFEQQTSTQLAALNKASHDVQASTGVTRRELSIGLEQAASRLEQALATRSGALANDVMGLAEMLESLSADLRSCISESIRAMTSASPSTEPIDGAIATPVEMSMDSSSSESALHDAQVEPAATDATPASDPTPDETSPSPRAQGLFPDFT